MSLNISDAVQLYTNLKDQTINLWVWFVAGNFAAVAAIFSAGKLNRVIRFSFIVGFVVYAIGNLSLLYLNLSVLDSLVSDIGTYIDKVNDGDEIFRHTLISITNNKTPVWVPMTFHFIVDIVIVVIVSTYKAKE